MFSHAIDYAFDDKESGKHQAFQDNNHEKFVLNSEIPEILEKFGIDIHYILNDKNFPLRENKIPDICAR